jgi:hypothetical protein
MKKLFFVLFCGLFLFQPIYGQTNFADQCLGIWKGTMKIYSRGILKDSVPVKMTVAKTSTARDYTWKTEYLSPNQPVTKDYILHVKDAEKGVYITSVGQSFASRLQAALA